MSPHGERLRYVIWFNFPATNNVAEYEALLAGLRSCKSLGIQHLAIRGDSQLVVQKYCRCFFTGNTIYGAGRRITSLVVAQAVGNKTQSLDRFGPSGRGNTLHPVCGYVYLISGVGEVCFAEGL